MNLRPITSADTEVCGRIIYEAFAGISGRHNFPHDFPSVEAGQGFADMVINSPDIWGVAAEQDGRFVGSNFLWEYDEISAVGPITVDPEIQAKGIGRELMKAVIERGSNAPGIRLVQAAYNSASMSLYTSLGFDIKEPLAAITGNPSGEVREGTEVRPLEEKDLEECSALHLAVHEVSRKNELSAIAKQFPATVAVRDGRIVAYMAAPASWHLNHAVGETSEDLADLIVGTGKITDEPVSFLLPTRQGGLFRRCLEAGMKVVMPLSLMAMGEYAVPKGAFIPSVLY